MQGFTCSSCRAVSRSRFHLRLIKLKHDRRRLHTSPARSQDEPFYPQSWYWETNPPTQANLAAAQNFFRAHRPFREWTGTAWRRHKASTPGGLLVPEIIFLGRSNVGKSSLLNRITYSSDLNRVSGTPGATKTMWAWSLAAKNPEGGAVQGWGGDCTPKVCLVDLPGYGFGSDSEWGNEIVTYMKNRKELRRAFIIIDALQGITKHDRKILEVLRSLTIPYQMIVSKCDKSGWQGSQTAVESALKPIRDEAELGSHKHPGLGELILVGGLQDGAPVRPYGVQNLQWSILRATGLDAYAMTQGDAHGMARYSPYTPGTITDTLNASRNQSLAPQLNQSQTQSAPSGSSSFDLSLQDFLADLLNASKKNSQQKSQTSSSRTSSQIPSSSRSSSARSDVNPVDQSLLNMITAEQSRKATPQWKLPSRGWPAGPNSPQASPPARTQPQNIPQTFTMPPASIASLEPIEGKGVTRGLDAFAEMVDRTPRAQQPKKVNGSSASQAPAPGKGVTRGLDAFESMFAEEKQTKSKSKTAARKGSRKKKSFSSSETQDSTRHHPQAPIQAPIGKGVSRGLDAFESMFAVAEAGKKKNKNRS